MTVLIALLRAIGPATHAKMSMGNLRQACEAAGLEQVATYISTGNIVFKTRKSAAAAQTIVEGVLRGFGLNSRVVMRKPDDLAAIVAANPFPKAAALQPSKLVVCFLAATPDAESLAKLLQYRGPERFKLVGRELCVDYPNGVTGSKLTPGVLERRLGTPATFRNWNTVQKLLAMARKCDS
jgi:uncharacterized protein (DUF1697 family)